MTYVLYERWDNLIFCPILNMLALAFADGAFKEKGIQKPEDIYSWRSQISKDDFFLTGGRGLWRPLYSVDR